MADFILKVNKRRLYPIKGYARNRINYSAPHYGNHNISHIMFSLFLNFKN